jgi:hypothetical protein
MKEEGLFQANNISLYLASLQIYNTKEGPETKRGQWYFVSKFVLTFCENFFSSDREKLLKIEAEVREITKGQLISEGNFSVFNSPKKQRKC